MLRRTSRGKPVHDHWCLLSLQLVAGHRTSCSNQNPGSACRLRRHAAMTAEHLHQETPPVVTVPGNAINGICRVRGPKFYAVFMSSQTHLPKPETPPTHSAAFACFGDSRIGKDAKEICSDVQLMLRLQNGIFLRFGAEPIGCRLQVRIVDGKFPSGRWWTTANSWKLEIHCYVSMDYAE